MNLESEAFNVLIKRSAQLRGQRDFAAAIDLIESRVAEFDPDCLLNAYMECFYAAREAGMKDKAREYAKLLAAIDPNIPSVEAFLKD